MWAAIGRALLGRTATATVAGSAINKTAVTEGGVVGWLKRQLTGRKGGGRSKPGGPTGSGGTGSHPAAHEEPGPKGGGRDIDRLWAKEARWNLMERAIGSLEQITVPTGVHGITVAVVGGPNADIRRCWYLALAAAFGRFHRSPVKAFYGLQMRAEWLITGKAVSVSLVYATNINAAQAASALNAGLESVVGKDNPVANIAGKVLKTLAGVVTATQGIQTVRGFARLIQRGPDQYTEGGPWPVELLTPTQIVTGREQSPPAGPNWTIVQGKGGVKYRRFTGAPESTDVFREVQGDTNLTYSRAYPDPTTPNGDATRITDRDPPLLPDYGRVITTGSKLDPVVQPPRPAVDGLSRGSLVQLVTAALGEAGTWPPRPSPLQPILGSSGRKANGDAVEAPVEASVDRLTEGPDGLLLPNGSETNIPRVVEES